MAMAGDYTPTEVSQLLADGTIQLIDVRQPHEHEAGRIAGGRLIVLDQLSAEAATIDRSTPVVFYCRSGARSAMATEAFAAAGFDAHNMAGGAARWGSVPAPGGPPPPPSPRSRRRVAPGAPQHHPPAGAPQHHPRPAGTSG